LYNYQRIKNLREDNDLTQGELAALLNTTQQQYSKYELGIQEIPVHHLITLADFYKTSTDYILNRTNNKKLYK
jgi:Predicted transcriptional regulators